MLGIIGHMNLTPGVRAHQAESSRICYPGCPKPCPPWGTEEQYDDLEVLAAIHLNDIIDAMEVQSDESIPHLDLDAGQVVIVSEELLREAEERGDEEPDLPDWQKVEWETAKRIASNGRFIPLPTKFDVTRAGDHA